MAGNPLIRLGTLNRIRGAMLVTDSPELNVTASYLGKEGISAAQQGQATLMLPQMTGQVTSPEPYVPVVVTVALLKTQSLSDLYKQRMEKISTIGDITIIPDATTLSKFLFTNCAIESVNPLRFDGTDAGYVVMISGTYLLNSDLWSLV